MKLFFWVLTALAFYVLSAQAAAATIEYACEPIEMLTAHADEGMGRKIDRENSPLVVLSVGAGRAGQIVTLYDNEDPSFEEDYKVVKTDGSMRWKKEYSNHLEIYTLFTNSMRMNRITQFQSGITNIDGTMLTTYTCKLKGH